MQDQGSFREIVDQQLRENTNNSGGSDSNSPKISEINQDPSKMQQQDSIKQNQEGLTVENKIRALNQDLNEVEFSLHNIMGMMKSPDVLYNSMDYQRIQSQKQYMEEKGKDFKLTSSTFNYYGKPYRYEQDENPIIDKKNTHAYSPRNQLANNNSTQIMQNGEQKQFAYNYVDPSDQQKSLKHQSYEELKKSYYEQQKQYLQEYQTNNNIQEQQQQQQQVNNEKKEQEPLQNINRQATFNPQSQEIIKTLGTEQSSQQQIKSYNNLYQPGQRLETPTFYQDEKIDQYYQQLQNNPKNIQNYSSGYVKSPQYTPNSIKNLYKNKHQRIFAEDNLKDQIKTYQPQRDQFVRDPLRKKYI